VALRVEDLLRGILERMAQIEREQAEAMRPFSVRRAEVIKDVKALHLDKLAVLRSARILAGLPGSEGFAEDPLVSLYLRTVQKDTGDADGRGGDT